MAENLHIVLAAPILLFGTFMVGLAYAQWTTRGMDVYRGEK